MVEVWKGDSLQSLVVLSEDLGWLLLEGADFSLEEPSQRAVSSCLCFDQPPIGVVDER